MDQWYVARGEAQKGPYTRAQLQSLAGKGVLRATDMLLQHGAEEWIAVREVSGLLPATPALPPRLLPPPLPAAAVPPTAAFAKPTEPPPLMPISSASVALWPLRRKGLWFGVGGVGLLALAIVPVLVLHNDSQVRERKGERLSGDDVTLLKLASAWHYYNGQRVSGDLATFLLHEDLIAREAVKPGDSGKLARHVLAFYSLVASDDQNRDDRKKLYSRFPGEVFKVAAEGALAGLKREDLKSLAEFRRGPAGRSSEAWLDDLRLNDIGRWSVMVGTTQTSVNVASTFEAVYAPRLGQGDLGWDRMAVTPLNGDRLGRRPSVGKFIALTYRGDAVLTNVVIVSRLKTTGASNELTVGQRSIMAANELSGFGDKNEDICTLFQLQNLVASMPKAGIAYVPALKQGDSVQVTLGNAGPEFLLGGGIAVYSDQGRLSEKAVEFEQPRTRGRQK